MIAPNTIDRAGELGSVAKRTIGRIPVTTDCLNGWALGNPLASCIFGRAQGHRPYDGDWAGRTDR